MQIAGILFPIPIMLLVPARRFLLPRFFSPGDLRELDAAQYEEAPPLPPELVEETIDGGRQSMDKVGLSHSILCPAFFAVWVATLSPCLRPLNQPIIASFPSSISFCLSIACAPLLFHQCS